MVAKLDALEERLRVFYREKGPVRPFFTICLLLAGAVGLLLSSFLRLSLPVRWDIGTKVIGGLLVCTGLWLTWRRIRVSDKQAETASRQVQAVEDGQVTERFTKAIEQLGASRDGEPNLEVRLGGIFALERIARDSEKDHLTVMEVLSAYVRENARLEPEETSGEAQEEEQKASEKPSIQPPRVDIQATLTVIGRREKREVLGLIDLAGARLQQAHLSRAYLPLVELSRSDLRGAQLQYANLEWATLWEADLRAAILWDAKLLRADLRGANLPGANLHRADLQGANLRGADLRGADLQGANLRGADLQRANLWGARGITKDQLAEAIIDEHTKLPVDLEEYRDELLESSRRNLEELKRRDRETGSPQQPPPQPE